MRELGVVEDTRMSRCARAFHSTEVKIGVDRGGVCYESTSLHVLTCGDVQTIILELDIHFHIGHPPRRAMGS